MYRRFKNPIQGIDPVTGKLVPLPLQWESPENSGGSIKKDSEKKKVFDLKPLDYSQFQDKTTKRKESNDKKKKIDEVKPYYQEPPSKIKKTDSVRKGLFTKPQNGTKYSSRTTTVPKRKSTTRNSMAISAKTKAPSRNTDPSSSPLLNMEEFEEELLTKKASLRGYPFKSPGRPSFNFSSFKSKPLSIPQIIVEEPNGTTTQNAKPAKEQIKINVEPKTPDSQSSCEFLKLEKMCIDSPVSSMCNLLQDTGLDSIKKPKSTCAAQSPDSLLEGLQAILASQQEVFQRFQEGHEKNMASLRDLIASVGTQGPESNRESSPAPQHRRSIRLLNRSPSSSNNGKLLVSPGIMRSADLRKSTLKKNLAARNKECPAQSCRTSKPIELFKTQSIPETPKTDRKCNIVGESPGMRYVSMMVQNQCLLLQDTPHK